MSLIQVPSILKSSSFRFALFSNGIIWVSIGIVLIFMYFQLNQSLWQEINDSLDRQSQEIRETLKDNPGKKVAELLPQLTFESKTSVSMQSGSISHMRMLSPKMQQQMESMHSAMGFSNPPRHMLYKQQSIIETEKGRLITRSLISENGESLLISKNIDYLNELDASLFKALLVGLSATFILALLGSYLLTRNSHRRINQINETCTTIMKGHLDHRIPVGFDPNEKSGKAIDDYDQMALNINAMLDKISDLMLNVRQVSDNIAHDLKSPLARLRTRLEILNEKAPSIEVQDAINDADRLLVMFKSLLGIARLENQDLQKAKAIQIKDIINDACELYEPVFEELNITFSINSTAGIIMGVPDLLIQAFSNLLDNAAKFTPNGGSVSVNCKSIDNGYLLIFSDTGPGIPAKEHKQVFERFHRLDSARNTPGFGLGLSLVKAIIELHKGTIQLKSQNGFKIVIALPIVDQN